jgi:uncharacterized protein (TIGR02453 family)
MPQFPGFQAAMPAFFKGLEKNNDREWFEPRKETYLAAAKAPMEDLVASLNAELLKSAPGYVSEPKKAIYRIYRDTRFSKDKTPYKTHIGAIFKHRQLEKHAGGGFYVGISHKEVEVAGGVYMPGPAEILILRNLFAENHAGFRSLTESKSFLALNGELKGDQLTRIPKGFPAAHPAEDLLRRKQWYWYVTLDPKLALTPKLQREVTKRFLSMLPALDMMNAALLASKKKESARLLL